MASRRNFKFSNSEKLFKEAQNYLPAGVSSNARVWKGAICPSYMPCSIFIKKGYGSHIWDVDGNEFIDYRLGYGPIILGHSFEAVRKEVHNAEKEGGNEFGKLEGLHYSLQTRA